MKEKLLASPVRVIAFSFFMVILVGSLLLWLPIANAKENCGYLNHLFIATSATCVTGLVSVVPYEQYTLFWTDCDHLLDSGGRPWFFNLFDHVF